jgi:hypothetical protein
VRAWFNASRLPVAIGAILLIVPWFYISWNSTVANLFPDLRFRSKPVAGVVQGTSESFSLHAVLTGRYQQSISRAVGMLSPVFKPAVRWKNQIYYTFLGTSGSNGVVVGRHRELLGTQYLREYCARDDAAFLAQADDWAARLRGIQDEFEEAGKLFLYIVTPNKVGQYPQFVPGSYKCPGDANAKAGKLAIWEDALPSHGVHFVDSAATLLLARQRYAIDMFPRGGGHWNELGAALAAQQVITAVNARHRTPWLTPFTFSWEVSYSPKGWDRDLLDILNLPYPDAHYPVPVLTYQSSPRADGCEAVKITEVGDSFLMGINDVLEKSACPPIITLWYYWDNNQFLYAYGERRESPVEESMRRQSLFDADVVFLEENEAGVPDSQHANRLMKELQTVRSGRDPGR